MMKVETKLNGGIRHRSQIRGFTLIEALIGIALVSFALIVMFGFHTQAVRSNKNARQMTACTYLAQTQLERLLALPWTADTRHPDLTDDLTDTTSLASEWAFLEHPNAGSQPAAINEANETTQDLGTPVYFVTWDLNDVDSASTWTRIRVRCQYFDNSFNIWRGTTISSYRFRDS